MLNNAKSIMENYFLKQPGDLDIRTSLCNSQIYISDFHSLLVCFSLKELCSANYSKIFKFLIHTSLKYVFLFFSVLIESFWFLKKLNRIYKHVFFFHILRQISAYFFLQKSCRKYYTSWRKLQKFNLILHCAIGKVESQSKRSGARIIP